MILDTSNLRVSQIRVSSLRNVAMAWSNANIMNFMCPPAAELTYIWNITIQMLNHVASVWIFFYCTVIGKRHPTTGDVLQLAAGRL